MTEEDAEAKFSVSPEHLTELYQRVETGRALTACALVEESLTMAIQSKMVRLLPRDVKDRIFGGTGPLSNFSSKIDIGFALGIISPATRTELHLLRKIRNKFAHSISDVYFHTEEIKKMCDKLPLAKELEDPNDAENRYLEATSRAINHLAEETKKNLGAGRASLLRKSLSLLRNPTPDQNDTMAPTQPESLPE